MDVRLDAATAERRAAAKDCAGEDLGSIAVPDAGAATRIGRLRLAHAFAQVDARERIEAGPLLAGRFRANRPDVLRAEMRGEWHSLATILADRQRTVAAKITKW